MPHPGRAPYDALVVGAGPAGSHLARLLARAGRRVALLDKAPFPRHKVCGGGLSRKSLALLGDGVAPAAQCWIGGALLAFRDRDPVLKDMPPPAGCTVARGLSLAELAAIIARSELSLGNDSGVTHMAAALGIPTVALFGPSDVQTWRPQGKRVRILTHEIECAPCSVAAMKSCGHRSCLRALKPAEVIEQLHALLEQSRLDKGGGRD